MVTTLAAIPQTLGRFICHQRPDRSFMSGAVQWPVCGRCSGLYLSAAVGIAAIALGGRALLASPLSAPRAWRVTLLIAALPTLVSWVLERAAWWVPTSTTRAWMAAPLGAAIGALVASLAVKRENAFKT
jgi:hypothetical protein